MDRIWPEVPGPWPAVLIYMDGIGIPAARERHCETLLALPGATVGK